MDQIILQPCRIRSGKIVPERDGKAITLSWKDALKKLSPSGSLAGGLLLRRLRVGDFIGLRKRQGQVNNFLLRSVSNGHLGDILKKQPTFADELVEVYRVKDTNWDANIEETAS